MQTYRLALIGFGNVGQGFAQILRDFGAHYEQQFGARFLITAISDLQKGCLYDPDGLDPAALLAAVNASGSLGSVSAPHKGWDALKTITESNADVVAELSFTDLKTGEPAISHLKAAIQSGKHVITTNKGPVALAFRELKTLADEHGVIIGVEGAVMSGTPSLRLGMDLLSAAEVTCIQGIINGTTNYILSQMDAGAAYADALAEAQAKGYAEADPTGDVEGFDAAGKVVILANLLMGADIRMADVDRIGITRLTVDDIKVARANGERWKLIGKVEKTVDCVKASVKPQCLPETHPLAQVGGATNAITFTTKLLGDVTLIGPGAGRLETGYALVGDLLALHRSKTI
ncbi:MAG: homoserine dehydrogenase [Leptolinea sp.]